MLNVLREPAECIENREPESSPFSVLCSLYHGRTNADFFYSVIGKKRNHLHHPNFGEFLQIRTSVLLKFLQYSSYIYSSRKATVDSPQFTS
jgi:hypothetical protein